MNPTDRKPKVALAIGIAPKSNGDSSNEPPPLTSPESGEPDSDDQDNVNNNAGQSCATCYSYQPSTGRCLMYPPHGADWSMVEAEDWCCQYKKGQQHEPSGGAQQPDMQSQQQQQPPAAGSRPY